MATYKQIKFKEILTKFEADTKPNTQHLLQHSCCSMLNAL